MSFLDKIGVTRLWQHILLKLNEKVDKVDGKGLSTNDYTTEEKEKLTGIEAGAQVNIQSDWEQTDETAMDFIKNKPDEEDALKLVTEIGFIEPATASDGSIYTDENGAIFSLT